MRLSLISYLFNEMRTEQKFYEYVTGYQEGLDELLDYTERTWTEFQRPGLLAPLEDWKYENRVAGYVAVKGIPKLLSEDTVRCADGIIGAAGSGENNASNGTVRDVSQIPPPVAVPEGVDPIDFQLQANLATMTPDELLEYFGRGSAEIIAEYQDLDTLRSLQNDPFKLRMLPDGRQLGGFSEFAKYGHKAPNHGCDPMLKLFEPQLYEPSRMTFVARFQRSLYSGGKIRIQSVADMGQFLPDPITRDDVFYQEQLRKNNEPWELLYTYPYQPKVYECFPTFNQRFDDREEYDAWYAQTDPDLLCPPNLRKEHVILKSEETSRSAEEVVERIEASPGYGFATRKTMSTRRQSIDLTMLNVRETRARYTGTNTKLLTGTADELDFDIMPTFNFDQSGGIPAGLEVTRIAEVPDLLDAGPAQRAGVQPIRDRLVAMISASGMYHVLVKSVLTPDAIENHQFTMQKLFNGVIYPITLIFWGERNVLVDEVPVPLVAETFLDPTSQKMVKKWDDHLVNDYVVFELWVMPGKGDSFLRIDAERYNATRSRYMLTSTNDATYYMNSSAMRLTYPLPTAIIPGKAMGGRASPISIVLAEMDVKLYNIDRNLYFENDFLSYNDTTIDTLGPPLYNDIRIWNRFVMQLIFGEDIFIKIGNNEVTTDEITAFAVREVMTKNVWLRNNLLLDDYFPMTDWLSDENKFWIVQQLNSGPSSSSSSNAGLFVGAESSATSTAFSPFGDLGVQVDNTTTPPPYNMTCQPSIWKHVLQVCGKEKDCKSLISGLRDLEGKVPPLEAAYRTCDAYCLAQQGGYECVRAAEEVGDPVTGLPTCAPQAEYDCDFDFGKYTDDAICECRPTTTTTTTPPPPPPPIPKVDVSHIDFILPERYEFFNAQISKFPGTQGRRNWGSMLFPYENPPPMPLEKVIQTPSANPDDNRWFIRSRRMFNHFVQTGANLQGPIGYYEQRSTITGWGMIPGFNLTKLSRAQILYPVLPNLVSADVHVKFELQYVLVNLAHSIIIQSPRGFLLQCKQPSVPSPQADPYRCRTCIDIVRSRLYFTEDAENNEVGFNVAPGAGGADGATVDPTRAIFGTAIYENIDPITGLCYDPFEMLQPQDAFDEHFAKFSYYVNMSLKGLVMSQQQIGDYRVLENAVPFSFFLSLTTAGDTRTAVEIRDDQLSTLNPEDPSTYNGDWAIRIHDNVNITVDAVFRIPNPHFVTGLPMEAPQLRMQFPEFNVREAGSWDKWKSTITVSFRTRNMVYFIDERTRFKAILIVLPQMYEHNILEPSEFKSLNRKFPTAMNQDWRQYRASKRYVVILIEAVGIEELRLDIDTYSWQFPVKVPSNSWPIDTTFQLALCRNYNPCAWPMPAEDYVVRFPIYGPTREEYLHLIEIDDTVYYRGNAQRSKKPNFLGRLLGTTPVGFWSCCLWLVLLVSTTVVLV
ncbi:unnamed protein product [Amoebophrya sp. A25]|nr:unnamed protein product [Amoebophrya sp. A25]|eukprot:GSA25T00002866001.1